MKNPSKSENGCHPPDRALVFYDTHSTQEGGGTVRHVKNGILDQEFLAVLLIGEELFYMANWAFLSFQSKSAPVGHINNSSPMRRYSMIFL